MSYHNQVDHKRVRPCLESYQIVGIFQDALQDTGRGREREGEGEGEGGRENGMI